MIYKYEKELHSFIKRYFKSKSFISYEELRFYERRIDIVAYSSKFSQVIAIEAKLINWRKAFQQALIYQLCSDLVYVAMPRERFGHLDTEKFRQRGIGFLAIYSSGRCRQLIAPIMSQNIHHNYRKSLIDNLGRT